MNRKACQIKVETMIHDLVKDELHRSNSFHLTFSFSSLPERGITPVRPSSYVEAMDFIDGRRRFHSSYQAATQQESQLTNFYM